MCHRFAFSERQFVDAGDLDIVSAVVIQQRTVQIVVSRSLNTRIVLTVIRYADRLRERIVRTDLKAIRETARQTQQYNLQGQLQ